MNISKRVPNTEYITIKDKVKYVKVRTSIKSLILFKRGNIILKHIKVVTNQYALAVNGKKLDKKLFVFATEDPGITIKQLENGLLRAEFTCVRMSKEAAEHMSE